MKFPYRIQRVANNVDNKKPLPFSALSMRTPRGRRRMGFLVIMTGLVVSNLYHSEMASEMLNQVKRESNSFIDENLPKEIDWQSGAS